MSSLSLSLMGAFNAWHKGATNVQFATEKTRALMAYLAVEADASHNRSTLATLFWGDRSDKIARRNLRQTLHRLNQALDNAQPGLSNKVLTVTRQTVQVNSEAIWVDVATFERQLSQSRAHAHRHLHTCHSCLEDLGEAVDLYRGELMAGFSLSDAPEFEQWLLFRRERLREQALSALDDLALAYEARGDYEQALLFARRLIMLEPWREEVYRLMMRAHALLGQRSEALGIYETCIRVLEEELAVEPVEETTALYEQLRSGKFGERRGEVASQLGVERVSLFNFPDQTTSFVGREQEMDEIVERLLDPDCRLLTLLGPGGIGKTRLSIQVVREIASRPGFAQKQFADGIFFIPLAATSTFDQVIISLGASMHLTFEQQHAAREQLRNHLSRRQILLVLDNLEQLLSRTTAQATVDLMQEILLAAPRVKVLATSREPLNLRSEWRYPLSGLHFPTGVEPDDRTLTSSAVALFVHAARHVQPSFNPTEEEQTAIIRICELVGGMPLALEIGATWVRLMKCITIATEIERSLDFLQTLQRDVPERHRSIRAVFAYSWALLSKSDQRALAQLSVFAGSFDLRAASAVTQASVLEISSLLDKSLLMRSSDSRYELHELVRQFAAEQLSEVESVHQRHADHYLALLLADVDTPLTMLSPDAQATLVQDLENVRQAWTFIVAQQQYETIIRSVGRLSQFYYFKGFFQEAAGRFAAAIDILRAVNRPADPASDHLTALNLLLFYEGVHLEAMGERRASLERFEKARTGWETLDDADRLSQALAEIGIIHWRLGDIPRARKLLEQSLEMGRQAGKRRRETYALHHLGNLFTVEGDTDAALPLLHEAQHLYHSLSDQHAEAGVLNDIAMVNYHLNDMTETRKCLVNSLDLCNSIGDAPGMIRAYSNLGYVALTVGNYTEAQRFLNDSMQLAGTTESVAIGLYDINNLGHLALLQGDIVMARTHYLRALRTNESAWDQEQLVISLLGFAALAAHQADYEQAARLLATIVAASSTGIDEGNKVEMRLYEETLQIVRSSLSQDQFSVAWSEGNAMTLEQAVSINGGGENSVVHKTKMK